MRLGDRDIAILNAVGRMKLLRTSDITALYFGSKQTAIKRLRRLLDSGYLDCFVSALHEDNIYGLSSKGKAILLELQGVNAKHYPTPKGIGHTNLKHLFALNAFRISLVMGLHAHPDHKLSYFRPEWQLKRSENPLNLDLIPDALFEIESTTSPGFQVIGNSNDIPISKTTRSTTFALEVDMGTEHPKLVGKQKVAKYRAVLDARLPLFGVEITRVLFLAPRLRRLHHLSKVMVERGVSDEFLLGLGPWAKDGGGWDKACGAGELIRGLDEGLVGEEILRNSILDRPRKGTPTASPCSKGTLAKRREVTTESR